MKNRLKTIKDQYARLPPGWRACLSCCLGVAVAAALVQLFFELRHSGPGPFLALTALYLLACILAGGAICLLLWLAAKIPGPAGMALVCAALVTAILLYMAPHILILTACAGCMGFLLGTRKPGRARWAVLLRGLGAVLASAVFITGLALLIWPGKAYAPPRDTAAPPFDPSLPGEYDYRVFYYAAPGQGQDPYPGQTALASGTVDASAFVSGWSGIRRRSLGYGPDALPINAQVWMPEGEGPFPLALIVHGNHEGADRSDGGYAWLGRLLASRGIIAASVDENFLNGSSWWDLFGILGLEEENDARARVLMAHLEQWHAWTATPGHPFEGKADLGRVALIGHSRGGEAVTAAAVFSGLERYPDNGMVAVEAPWTVRAVVAIAPVDGQYLPADLPARLENTSYLVLHGARDMDVSVFDGADTYHRAAPPPEGYKAKVYLADANHGQFNSRWGNTDTTGLRNLIFNRAALMPPEAQQRAAGGYISAFLESILHGREEYRALFTSPGDFAALAGTRVIVDYHGGGEILLAAFEENPDLTDGSLEGVAFEAAGFSRWSEEPLPAKGYAAENRALRLSWNGDAVFTMTLAPGLLTAGDTLAFSAAALEDAAFTLRLTDEQGRRTEIDSSALGGIPRPVAGDILKPPYSRWNGSQPVLGRMEVSIADLGLSGSIKKVEWIMTSGPATLFLDDIRR